MTEADLEQGAAYGYHRRSDVSIYYSDGEEEDVTSCYSYFYSTTTGGTYEYEGGESRKVSSVMSSSSLEMDDGDGEATVTPEKDCRICHLGVVETSGGGAIELGCSCKEDLAVAHRQCAETWFKIKGDKICEICQSVARNVGGANEMVVVTVVDERELRNGGGGEETAAVGAIENRWQPQRLVNIVLACMVFGFFISWLFHFHDSSSS
ncbi:BnaA03g17510D [Brassica napus]|uniref:BnaA03g17510D protein n=1 Tax=Brassica napus TaxID=3708 RepID=A0A078F042_BRANA|nr:BnaA03g17510D [Brassica napus]